MAGQSGGLLRPEGHSSVGFNVGKLFVGCAVAGARVRGARSMASAAPPTHSGLARARGAPAGSAAGCTADAGSSRQWTPAGQGRTLPSWPAAQRCRARRSPLGDGVARVALPGAGSVRLAPRMSGRPESRPCVKASRSAHGPRRHSCALTREGCPVRPAEFCVHPLVPGPCLDSFFFSLFLSFFPYFSIHF